MIMNRFVKPALALGIVGAMALAVATPSEARSGRNAAVVGAGIAGFAVGTALGAAAASNSGYYYGPYGYQEPAYGYYREPAYGYNSAPAYEGYAYAPSPTFYDRRDPSSYYRPGGSYGPHSYTGWDNRERSLRGGDL